MSSWIMHLRIAQKVNEYVDMLPIPFYVGSIAPDSGRKLDSFNYDPPKNISHCYDRRKDRLQCNDEFFEKYAKSESDPFKRSFNMGYYVHVLTDTYFVRDIVEPLINTRGREFWRSNIERFRLSWTELDCRFLEQNRSFSPLASLMCVSEFPDDLLDYFGAGDIYERVKSVCNLYSHCKSDKNTQLIGIGEEEAEEFVSTASKLIVERIKSKL